jgi:hypothetical protein
MSQFNNLVAAMNNDAGKYRIFLSERREELGAENIDRIAANVRRKLAERSWSNKRHGERKDEVFRLTPELALALLQVFDPKRVVNWEGVYRHAASMLSALNRYNSPNQSVCVEDERITKGQDFLTAVAMLDGLSPHYHVYVLPVGRAFV